MFDLSQLLEIVRLGGPVVAVLGCVSVVTLAGEIEDAFDILGDRALLQFVQTAFGLPVQMSFSSLERQ